MFQASLTWDQDILATLSKRAKLAQRLVGNQLDLQPVLNWYQQEVKERLAFTPGPVAYPIQWTSERQRRAYFATDGFGHGIPYRRTFGLQNDWDVRLEENTIIIKNQNPAATYVIGERQQRFHRNTGWPYAPTVLRAIVKDTPGVRLIARAWFKYWTRL